MSTKEPYDSIRAEHLIEALPYILEYRDSIVVIKFGGHAMVSEDLKDNFAKDLTLLKLLGFIPVVVHGGGPDINDMLLRLDIKSTFVGGLRYTDSKTMDVVEMVLGGKIGKDLAWRISQAGGQAVSLSGKDSKLIEVKPVKAENPEGQDKPPLDLGLVGEPIAVNTHLILKLCSGGYIPVIAPVGTDSTGKTYNINADTAAAHVAIHLKAKKLILLTDVPGVLDQAGELILTLNKDGVDRLKSQNLITGGMLPKIDCCLEALSKGCEAASIIDGRMPHSILLEIFTHRGCGTEITLA
ncbi:MAG: acetylglutamate kinase [Deltaproteobacteria bacterium]|jgi:acetylglutamate kinase|nr:acetylglutamate kinase [Deltaproteobacteria bacterium]